MKTYIYIILSICILSILCLYHKNNRQQDDIVRLSKAIRQQNIAKKDSLVNLIEQVRFKEDFYSTQLSLKSDWIIFYVTILFGIFGVIGVAFFFEKIIRLEHDLKNEFKAKIEKYESENHFQRKQNIEIRKELYITSSKNNYNYAKYSTNKTISFSGYLLSSHELIKAIELEQDIDQKETLVIALIGTLQLALLSISGIDKEYIELIKDSLGNIHEKIFEINSFKNIESRDLCAKIIIKINNLTL